MKVFQSLLILLIFSTIACRVNRPTVKPCFYQNYDLEKYRVGDILKGPQIRHVLTPWPQQWHIKEQLQPLADFLIKNHTLIVELRVHTDHRDSFERNLKLTQGRADYIRAALSGYFDIDSTRMIAVGKGENEPFVIDHCTAKSYEGMFSAGDTLNEEYIMRLTTNRHRETAHEINRRLEVVIIGIRK